MRVPKGGIAFFDSGIGGLTVLNECNKYIKEENFYYYGDNHHAPYGNLSERQIQKYVARAFRLFKKLKVKAVVLACNTVTAVCVEKLRKKYSFDIIGAEPAILSAAKKGGTVFVLTTRATFSSQRFQLLYDKARQQFPNAELRLCPCDRLAGVIEQHLTEKFDYSEFLPSGTPTSVVLGCTHYVYLKEYIKKFYGCAVFDGNRGIAKRLKSVLQNNLSMKPTLRRDERPPYLKKIFFRPFLTTFYGKKIKKNKTNKCSYFLPPKKTAKSFNCEATAIFFLGKNAPKNASIYKQMFGE